MSLWENYHLEFVQWIQYITHSYLESVTKSCMIHGMSFTIKYTTRNLSCLYCSVPAPDISTCLHSFKCFYLDSRDLNSAASLDTLDRNSLPEPGSKCPIKSLISKSIDNFQSNLNNRIFLYLIIKLQHKYEKLMTE